MASVVALRQPDDGRDIEAGRAPGPELICAPGSLVEETRRAALRIARTDATVLVTGETGTGKEVLARMVHANSPRARAPFVPVNCGAIPAALLESELFGCVRGAFTDATATRKGRVALAEGGTLFLDEIGELPLPLQVKLLRLIQERSYEPVGDSASVRADFRLIAATNRDLLDEVQKGRFRSDLYYRLFVCPLHVPALRERPADVPYLFRYFWQRRGETRPVDGLVVERLARYAWPGNVRELENLVERLSVCSESATIRLGDLPPELAGARALVPRGRGAAPEGSGGVASEELEALLGTPLPAPAQDRLLSPARRPAVPARPMRSEAEPRAFEREGFPSVKLRMSIDLQEFLRALESAYIDEALALCGNNKKEAAALLGMGRTTLVEKLRRRGARVGPRGS